MGRTVLLRHELPDGSVHYDWMIQPGSGGALVTFRVGERIDRASIRSFRAERLPPHREAYLEYEGPVSGGRGTVARIAEGILDVELDSERAFACRGVLGGNRVRFEGAQGDAAWEFTAEPVGGE